MINIVAGNLGLMTITTKDNKRRSLSCKILFSFQKVFYYLKNVLIYNIILTFWEGIFRFSTVAHLWNFTRFYEIAPEKEFDSLQILQW